MKKLFTFMCLATCATQALCAQEALPFIEAFDDELSMDSLPLWITTRMA